MQAEDTPESNGKDERPAKGTHNQREQMEQFGTRRETQELKLPDNSVEKLLTVLKKVRAVRAPTRSTWVVEPLIE